MSDIARPAVPSHINTQMRFASGSNLRTTGTTPNPVTSAWTTIDLAIYIPLFVPWPYVVKRMFWGNGSSAGGNADIGIYSPFGSQLWHAGATACSGNAQPQYVTVSPNILLTPGSYLLAFAMDNTTANRLYGTAAPTAMAGRSCGLFQQALGSLALPAEATFSTYSACLYPLIGITNTASGF
jgi:hypothetical protein